MFKGLLIWVRGLSVGLKLTGTLVLVVLFTSLVLSLVNDRLVSEMLNRQARQELAGKLTHVLNMADLTGKSPEEALRGLKWVFARNSDLGEGGSPTFFALDISGKVLASTEPEVALPALDKRMEMLSLGPGVHYLDVNGRTCLVALHVVPGQWAMAAQTCLDQQVDPLRLAILSYTVAAALVLSLAVGLVAAFLARRELSSPLGRLTREAERVARGDLSAPEPLPRRADELGRLSRALNRMAVASQIMVAEARSNQLRFQQLFTENHDGAFIIGTDGRLEDVNPALVAMCGFANRREMLGMSDTAELFVHPQERLLYLETLRSQGYVQDFPATMRRRDGSSFEALITATMRGETARFGLVRDFTQMRKAQTALKESEERYRRIIENSPDIIYRWSVERNNFDYVSPAGLAITGYSAADMEERPELLLEMVHPDWREQVEEHWAALLKGKLASPASQDFAIVTKGGRRRWLRENCIVVRDHDGKPQALEGIVTDVTDRKEAELALVRGQEMVEATLQGLPVAVLVIDQDHKVVHWNRAMENLSGVTAAEKVGSDQTWKGFYDEPRPVLADLIIDGDLKGLQKYYGKRNLKKSTLVEGGYECEGFFPELNGLPRQLYFLAAPVTDEDGRVVRAVETLVDLTEKRELEEELRRLSITDDLTGLANQRFFFANLEREIQKAKRYGHPLTLMMIDIDRFKGFNDRFGHLEGDRVLALAAQALKNGVRATDLPCRYGGEEFTVLLPHTGAGESSVVAERIRKAVERLEFFPNTPEGLAQKPENITVSLGLASFRTGLRSQDLVRLSDDAMYAAKNAGRNRTAVHLGEARGIQVLNPDSSAPLANLEKEE